MYIGWWQILKYIVVNKTTIITIIIKIGGNWYVSQPLGHTLKSTEIYTDVRRLWIQLHVG